METTLGDGLTTWVRLKAETAHGRGGVFPRLTFAMNARTPRERMDVQLLLMRGELVAGNETLGEGLLTGESVYHSEVPLKLEVPVSRMALEFLDQQVTGNRVDVTLHLTGWLRGRDDNTDGPQFESRPKPGEWVFEAFGRARSTDLLFQVARSDWFTQVLEPLGSVEYICTEIAVPRADSVLRKSVNHLRQAERALREGHDPAVFSTCRAAVEALPGALQNVYDRLEDGRERKALNGLLLQASKYFHLGRHTADEGPQQGEFTVDHRDATFALNLAKLLIAHTSRVLDRPPK